MSKTNTTDLLLASLAGFFKGLREFNGPTRKCTLPASEEASRRPYLCLTRRWEGGVPTEAGRQTPPSPLFSNQHFREYEGNAKQRQENCSGARWFSELISTSAFRKKSAEVKFELIFAFEVLSHRRTAFGIVPCTRWEFSVFSPFCFDIIMNGWMFLYITQAST